MKNMRHILSLILILMLFIGAASADKLRFYQQETTGKANEQKMQYISDVSCFWNDNWVEVETDKLLPVYAYPSETGWRGENGKACVDLRGGFTRLAWTDDEQWLLIDYKTNTGHRVGYIRVPEGLHMGGSPEYLMHIPMILVCDTYITDDPNGAQKPIAQLKAGDTVDVLGYTDAYWAYIETSIDGKKARAFMPIMNLQMPKETENTAMEKKLEGTWCFIGGAELLGYGAIFDGKGSVQICDTEDFENLPPSELIIRKESAPLKYRVYENTLGERRYPDCPYVLEIESEEHFSRFGLYFDINGNGAEMFSLIIAGEGGGYERARETEIIRE